MPLFKAFIRVVKSVAGKDIYSYTFGSSDIVKEPIIEANDKEEVKNILLNKYPQFFQNGKIYERETKDIAQFFYVVIFPLYKHEIMQIEEGPWVCAYCNQQHENKYVNRPYINERLLGADLLFCKTEDNYCFNNYKKEKYKDIQFADDENYIKKDSPIYIYKCTEKSTNKCYIGKTRNEPFFRWFNHLRHSSAPFGTYLRTTQLSDWFFEVLNIFPSNTPDDIIFLEESKYILQYNSVSNGYNTILSNKTAIDHNPNQMKLI